MISASSRRSERCKIALSVGRRNALAIGSRRHDHPMQAFQAPVFGNQFIGNPVEKFWMRRWVAQLAEVGGRRNKPFTEVMHPHTVGDHACQQRIVATGQPPSKGESPSRCWQRFIVRRELGSPTCRCGNCQRRGRYDLFWLLVIAAKEQFGFRIVIGRFDQSSHNIHEPVSGPESQRSSHRTLPISVSNQGCTDTGCPG